MLGNRIISTFAERIATQDSPNGKPCCLEKSIFLICLQGILRAGGIKDTGSVPLQRGQPFSVESDQSDAYFLHMITL